MENLLNGMMIEPTKAQLEMINHNRAIEVAKHNARVHNTEPVTGNDEDIPMLSAEDMYKVKTNSEQYTRASQS
jgi:hypothetical protein